MRARKTHDGSGTRKKTDPGRSVTPPARLKPALQYDALQGKVQRRAEAGHARNCLESLSLRDPGCPEKGLAQWQCRTVSEPSTPAPSAVRQRTSSAPLRSWISLTFQPVGSTARSSRSHE